MSIVGRTSKFNFRITVLAAVALVAAVLTGCDSQSSGSAADTPRQVTVVGSGKMQGTPDTLTADVGIEFIAPDVTTAMNQTNERQQAVIDALLDTGVDRKDIATTQVSLQPQSDNPASGYRAANSVQVRIRRLESASRQLALIASTGGDATRINSVSYSIDNDSDLVRDARSRAFDDAKDRAEQYAQLSGLKRGKVISISESASGGLPSPGTRAPMAADVPLEPGQQTVGFSVTVVWELR